MTPEHSWDKPGVDREYAKQAAQLYIQKYPKLSVSECAESCSPYDNGTGGHITVIIATENLLLKVLRIGRNVLKSEGKL